MKLKIFSFLFVIALIISVTSRVGVVIADNTTDTVIDYPYETPFASNEIINLRTETSKTYDLGSNKYSLDASISSVHYKDVLGNWQDINNEFTPALAPWDWQMFEASYHVRVKEDITAGQIIEFEVDGSTVYLQPMALEWSNDLSQIQLVNMPQDVPPLIVNNTVELLPEVEGKQGNITWENAYGQNIDFTWQSTPSRLNKTLTIANLSDLPLPQQYIIDGGNAFLRLNLIFAPSSDLEIYVNNNLWNKSSKVQTFDIIEFRKNGETLWGFMPLMYWDSVNSLGQSIATLEKVGNKLYISVRVPLSWLQTAVFPVYIDTDVDSQVDAGSNDARRYMGSAGFSGTTNYSTLGYRDNSSYYASQMFARWTGITISGTITSSNMSLYPYSTAVGSPQLKVYGVKEDNPDASTSTATFDADPLTTAGTDWDGAFNNAAWNNSPSLNAIFQELVDNFTIDNEAVMVQVKDDLGSGNNYNVVRHYEYTGNLHGAKLHVEYEIPSEEEVSFIPLIMIY